MLASLLGDARGACSEVRDTFSEASATASEPSRSLQLSAPHRLVRSCHSECRSRQFLPGARPFKPVTGDS